MNGIENSVNEQFSQAYLKGFSATRRFLISRGVYKDTAEEIAQAAWAKGWEYRFQLQQPELLGVWVNSIAKNMLLNQIRMNQRFSELTESPSLSPKMALMLDAQRMLNKCPSRDAQLLSEYYIMGYTTDEIAKNTGSCPATIRVRLLRLRRSLKRKFTPLSARQNSNPVEPSVQTQVRSAA